MKIHHEEGAVVKVMQYTLTNYYGTETIMCVYTVCFYCVHIDEIYGA